MGKEAVFRFSTLAERQEFYEREFSIKKVKAWFKKNKMPFPQLCAIDAGGDTGIILDKKLKGKMLYFKFSELNNKIKKYIPEDVYYDRNYYKRPDKILKTLNFNQHAFDKHISQELVFDIDVDNVKNSRTKVQDGFEFLNTSRIGRYEDNSLSINRKVSTKNLKKAYSIVLELKKELRKDTKFKNLKVVYSGRGFHIHVLDKRAYYLTIPERELLNKKFSYYPIDPWVSRGFIRLIRIPYTLNSLVSRVVTPIDERKGFQPKETLPKFLT